MFENIRNNLASLISVKGAFPTTFAQTFVSPISPGGAPPRLGTRQLLEAYSTMPWLRAIVNKVGRAVGSTSWKLFVVQEGSGNRSKIIRPHKLQRADFDLRQKLLHQQEIAGNLVEIEDHPLLDLLSRGNEHLLGGIVFQLTQQYMDLVGEAFWLLEKTGTGVPVNIWPLSPDWVKALPSTNIPFYKIGFGSVQIDIPVTEILNFKDPDPVNPYGRGVGIAKALGDELETDEYAAKHLKSFFFNRARPDLIISGETLSREDTKRLEEKWLEKTKGFWNAFRPHFLNRKVEIKELGQDFNSMQMVELRKYERDMVIQVYGIPPEKLGLVNESKRSTISAADLFWTKDILQPRLELMRAVMQKELVPLFDERLFLDFESHIVQDAEHELAVMKAAPWHYTRNEWRVKARQEDIGEIGDIFLVDNKLTATDMTGEPLFAPEPVDDEGSGNEDEEDNTGHENDNDEDKDNSSDDEEKALLEAVTKRIPDIISSLEKKISSKMKVNL